MTPIRHHIAALALAAVSGASAAWAQTYDIAGVTIGMPLEEARAAVLENGYTEDTAFNGSFVAKSRTYAQIVAEERVPGNQQTSFSDLKFTKDDGAQTLGLQFVQTAQGPLVRIVNYDVTGIDREAFRERVVARYGEPDKKDVFRGELYEADGEAGAYGFRETLILKDTSLDLDSNLNMVVTKAIIAERNSGAQGTDF